MSGFSGGPGGWQPPEDSESDHGAIIAGTFAALVIVAMLVVVLLLALWRFKIEPSCAREGQVQFIHFFLLLSYSVVYYLYVFSS